MAVCLERQGEFSKALDLFSLAVDHSRTSEHRAAALLGVGRTTAAIGEFDASTRAIDEARQIEPACDLISAMKPLVRYYGTIYKNSPGSPILAPLKRHLKSIVAMSRANRIVIPQQPLRDFKAALLNGDFELQSMRYWNESSGASWASSGAYQSTAEVTSADFHQGGFALHVTGSQCDDPNGHAKTGQSFSVSTGASYSISIWAKANGLSEAALKLMVDGETVIEVPAGSYGWTNLRGDFSVAFDAEDKGNSGTEIVTARLDIVSLGAGEVWLDDLVVTEFAANSSK